MVVKCINRALSSAFCKWPADKNLSLLVQQCCFKTTLKQYGNIFLLWIKTDHTVWPQIRQTSCYFIIPVYRSCKQQ